MLVGRNSILHNILRLFLILVSVLLYLVGHEELFLTSSYSLVVIFSIFCMLIKERKSFFNEYSLIIFFMVLFNFGQVIPYVIESSLYLPIYYKFSESTIVNGIIYSLLCIQTFDMAYSLFYSYSKYKLAYSESSSIYLASARIISKIFLCFLTPVVLYSIGVKTFYSLRYGYMNLYDYNGGGYNESQIMIYITSLFVIMCMLNIISHSYNFKKAKTVSILLILYLIISFFSGSRSSWLGVVLPCLLMYYNHTKQQKVSLIKILLLGFIMILGSVFMSYFRLLSNKSVEGIFESLTYIVDYNPLITMMAETGGSIQPLLYCIDIFSNGEPFRFGESYLASLFILIPNIGNILGDVHPAAQHAGLSTWLMNYMALSHGPGFSIVAESYYNFGPLGFIVFIVWAFIFSRILGSPNSQSAERNFIAYSVMFLILPLIRGSASDFIRYFVFEVLFVDLLVRIYASIIKKRKQGGDYE